jgi:hypothetical protein
MRGGELPEKLMLVHVYMNESRSNYVMVDVERVTGKAVKFYAYIPLERKWQISYKS